MGAAIAAGTIALIGGGSMTMSAASANVAKAELTKAAIRSDSRKKGKSVGQVLVAKRRERKSADRKDFYRSDSKANWRRLRFARTSSTRTGSKNAENVRALMYE